MEVVDEYDNLTLQTDEIEALSSIYLDEWRVEDVEQRVYSIAISPSSSDSRQDRQVKLQVRLPPDYPKHSPPFYELSAPWMDRTVKYRLSAELEDLYCAHIGESVLYLWIEKIREYLCTLSTAQSSDVVTTSDGAGEQVASFCEEPLHLVVSEGELGTDHPIYHGEPFTEKKSTFQAHLSPVMTLEQVKYVLAKLKSNRKISSATHNIMAYRIYIEPNKSYIQDCDDDGETHAGSRLLHLLEILNVQNVMVVVSRWYGGILLGPNRFKHINNAARSILEKYGFINAEKSVGPSTTKKKN